MTHDFVSEMFRQYEHTITASTDEPEETLETLRSKNHLLRKKVSNLETELVRLKAEHEEELVRITESILKTLHNHLPTIDEN